MAVELCKVNLWLEALEPGKPLTFLDAHIKCGNSLVGVGPGMDVYNLVIPDEAFDPVTGDDKKVAGALKKRNKEERKGQLTFDLSGVREEPVEDYAARLRQVELMPEDDAGQVAAKAAAYEALQADYQAQHRRLLADLWTAAFFWRLQLDPNGALAVPTQGEWRNARLGKPSLGLAGDAHRLADENRFFHWTLEFPDVFDQGGFDCVLGNPPWERIKLQEEEFFSVYDSVIANAPTKAARRKLIEVLPKTNPPLAIAFERAKHAAEATSRFIRVGERFLLSAVGDINTYPLFTEIGRVLISKHGYVGLIVPTGIATDDTTKDFFGDITQKRNLACLYDFENRENLFVSIDSRMKFCLLVLSAQPVESSRFAFFTTNTNQLSDEKRRFSLSPEQISLFNPNTHTLPLFRTRFDFEMARKIYQHVPVLINEAKRENLWNINFITLLHMANASGCFVDEQLPDHLPMYESKMMAAYDHRYANVIFNRENQFRPGQPEPVSLADHQDPHYFPKSQWYVPVDIVKGMYGGHLPRWVFSYKRIVGATNERTMSAAFLPNGALSDSLAALSSDEAVEKQSCLLANFNCLILDFIVRLKIGTTSINQFAAKQLPVLPPSAYTSNDISFVARRVLELTYTASDLKPYAEDMGYEGDPFSWDEERRALLRAELDAYYAKLYGLTRDELRYILDPQDVYGADFPGETFRVLKDKELRQFGEYRTRRLVLEAWDRLEGVEPAAIEKPVVSKQPAPVKEVYAPQAKEKPARAVKEKAVQETPGQPTFSDFGLYKCGACGKMVMGFDRENHAREAHKGKGVEWVKVK